MAISEAVSTPLVIDGQERSTAETFAVYDPHDGSVTAMPPPRAPRMRLTL